MQARGFEPLQENSRSESCLTVFALFVVFGPSVWHSLEVARMAHPKTGARNVKAEHCKHHVADNALNHLESAALSVRCCRQRTSTVRMKQIVTAANPRLMVGTLCFAASLLVARSASPEAVDFARDIRPLFEQHCFK